MGQPQTQVTVAPHPALKKVQEALGASPSGRALPPETLKEFKEELDKERNTEKKAKAKELYKVIYNELYPQREKLIREFVKTISGADKKISEACNNLLAYLTGSKPPEPEQEEGDDKTPVVETPA